MHSKINDLFDKLAYSTPNPKIVSILKSNSNLLGHRILDLCCGSGRYSGILINSLGKEVVGIDHDQNLIQKAYNKYGRKKGLRFSCKDIKSFNSIKKFSSIVFLGNSISHFSIKEMEKIIFKYKNYLQKGGIFVIELSLPTTLLSMKKMKWNGVIEDVLSFSEKTGKLKRSMSLNGKKFIFYCYVWFPFILDYILQRSEMKLIKSYRNGNSLVLFYGK